jgi:tetratricopeptide (TPR) repeat protein
MNFKNIRRSKGEKMSLRPKQNGRATGAEKEHSRPEFSIPYKQAVEKLSAQLDEKKDPGAYIALAQFCYRHGQHSLSVEYYKKALDLDNQNLKAMKGLAMAYYSMQVSSEADYWFTRCLEINKNDVDILYNLGTLHHSMGDYTKAVEYYQRVLEINKKDTHAYLYLGSIYYTLGNFEQAMENLRKALSLAPENPEINSFIGTVLEAVGKDNEAEIHYRKSLKKDPRNGVTYLNLGRLLWKKGINYGALKNAETARELFIKQGDQQNEALALWDAGWYHFSLNDWSRSIEASRKALDLNPGLSLVWFNLGLALLHQGRENEAFESYVQGVKSLANLSQLKTDAIDDLEFALQKNFELPGGARILKYLYEQYKYGMRSSVVSSVKVEKSVESLPSMLLERYREGQLDEELYSRVFRMLDSEGQAPRDEWSEKISYCIEEFCQGKLNKIALKAAMDAIERQRSGQSKFNQ